MKLSKVFVTLGALLALLVTNCNKSDDPAVTVPASILGEWKDVSTSVTGCKDVANNSAETPCVTCYTYSITANTFTYSNPFGNFTGTYSLKGDSITINVAGGCSPKPCTVPVTTTVLTYVVTSSKLVFSQSGFGAPQGCKFNAMLTRLPLPLLTTTGVTAIMFTTASSGGEVIADGGATVTARGVCYSTSASPTISSPKTTDGSGTGSFTSNLSGLTPGTTYYLRAYATSANGTSYGNEQNFTTGAQAVVVTPGGGVKDADGNTYASVILNTQEWMSSNLRTTKYTDGTTIPNVTDATWSTTTSGAWCYNNNTTTYNDPYGKLYNGYAVADSRKLCPTGWHVPTDNEWTVLQSILGGSGLAGGKMKESGTTHWLSPNTGTNESGLTALPGGYRNYFGDFFGIGEVSTWWSATAANAMDASYRYVRNSDSELNAASTKKESGFSIRCVKD